MKVISVYTRIVILGFLLFGCTKNSLRERFRKISSIKEEAELFQDLKKTNTLKISFYNKSGKITSGSFKNHINVSYLIYQPKNEPVIKYKIKDWKNIYLLQY